MKKLFIIIILGILCISTYCQNCICLVSDTSYINDSLPLSGKAEWIQCNFKNGKFYDHKGELLSNKIIWIYHMRLLAKKD